MYSAYIFFLAFLLASMPSVRTCVRIRHVWPFRSETTLLIFTECGY